MDKRCERQKPKYQALKEYIIETIEQEGLKTGDKIWSENELAKKFMVSRHTVRQAIGELTNEGWLYKVHGKGTYVGERIDQKSSKIKTIGVMTTYLDDYIFPSIILGMDQVLSKAGYNLVLGCTYNHHDKERVCLENFIRSDIQGIIIEPTKSALPNPNLDLYRQIIDKGIPMFFIHGCYQELDCPYVVVDDTKAGYLATRYLIDLGHKSIGGIFKIDDIQGHYRFKGFQKALAEDGISLKDSNILWFDTDDIGEEFIKLDHKKFEVLIKSCSAIICYNDQVALKIVNAIKSMEMNIPDDISLVSFDDSQLAVVSEVKLTTVAHPQKKLGRLVAESLINKIDGREVKDKVKMEPELIVRDSAKEYE
ncbi:MAG: GntR family transcriptional regulator [Caldicoprobacterales bacterium]